MSVDKLLEYGIQQSNLQSSHCTQYMKGGCS